MHIARTIRCVKDLLTMYIVKSFGMSPGMHVVFFEMSEFAYNVHYEAHFNVLINAHCIDCDVGSMPNEQTYNVHFI